MYAVHHSMLSGVLFVRTTRQNSRKKDPFLDSKVETHKKKKFQFLHQEVTFNSARGFNMLCHLAVVDQREIENWNRSNSSS